MALIELINHNDIPLYFLHTTAQALSIIEDAGMPNLNLQYDVYHAGSVTQDTSAASTARATAPKPASAGSPPRSRAGA